MSRQQLQQQYHDQLLHVELFLCNNDIICLTKDSLVTNFKMMSKSRMLPLVRQNTQSHRFEVCFFGKDISVLSVTVTAESFGCWICCSFSRSCSCTTYGKEGTENCCISNCWFWLLPVMINLTTNWLSVMSKYKSLSFIYAYLHTVLPR